MSNLVCVTGDFCSGSTLVFTLFRKTGRYRCLYEPLHENLREFLVYGLRPDEASHHFFVDQYYREFNGLRHASALSDPRWGRCGFHVPATAAAEDLYRYFSYIFGASFGVAPRVMFKENRLAFRLAWFRSRFPQAKIVHIHRRPEAQWRSIVRRVQAELKRTDVGQDRVDFNGFGIATWCEDLKADFPELDGSRWRNGFERFSALWQASYNANLRDADVSIAYEDLLANFMPTARRMFEAVGQTQVDVEALREFVVQNDSQPGPTRGLRGAPLAGKALLNRALRWYAAAYTRRRWPPVV